ncbi:hypothetical protein N7524_006560 [Penicillium chrysogenum]|nr:hypothetical protein N7524_006560 [Penicillium chrysogenum]
MPLITANSIQLRLWILWNEQQKRCASSVNRTRASSMATTNSTTRPMMLEDQVNQRADSLVIFAVP